MPTYNCGPKVEETIKSVLSQKDGLYEYIIIDGGSTDSTLEVIKKYGDQIKVISESDQGIYDAFNKGIAMATGKYLYFLGAGDLLRRDILEQLENIVPDDKLVFVYGAVYFPAQGAHQRGEVGKSKFRFRNISHQAIFYERTIFEVIGKYDLRYKYFADYVFNMKCFNNRRVKKMYVGHVIVDYERGGLSETQDDIHFRRDFPRLVRKYLGPRQYVLLKLHSIRTRLLIRTRLRRYVRKLLRR
jgi:glycosyltransferase involved in cell wall biosynthesis